MYNILVSSPVHPPLVPHANPHSFSSPHSFQYDVIQLYSCRRISHSLYEVLYLGQRRSKSPSAMDLDGLKSRREIGRVVARCRSGEEISQIAFENEQGFERSLDFTSRKCADCL